MTIRNMPKSHHWRPVRDLPPALHSHAHQGARNAAAEWQRIRRELENPALDRSSMDLWIRSQNRAFAIETGQLEGLYLLRRGVTETLIAEGFEGVRGVHSATSISDKTLRGLLTDQETALNMMFAHVKDERPLTESAIREWHALLTRHQAHATGRDIYGRRVDIPLRRGQYKIHPNNPLGRDGFVFEYCPPEQVTSEMEKLMDCHRSHRDLKLAPETEAAWLHHEFVRIHPFQDGNGRISRLLMAYVYAKAGEFPPVINTTMKDGYIIALENADQGRLNYFIDYLGLLGQQRSFEATGRAQRVLAGMTHYRHGNGGLTDNGVYHPPEDDGSDEDDTPPPPPKFRM